MIGESVCVIGGGYVGLVTAAAIADSGRRVTVVEIDPAKLDLLRRGRAPIYEPGLDELLDRVTAAGTLAATGDIAEAVRGSAYIVVAVGTPPARDGGADLGQVRAAISAAAQHAGPDAVIVLKSTAPPGTAAAMRRFAEHDGRAVPLVVCPEFLREGCALKDVFEPARIVVGGDDPEVCARAAALFAHEGTRTLITDATSAELIKYGSNAFLALKISFINEIAHLCELTGADIDSVADGLGADPRIGRSFLDAGLGFGGSCFPKDVSALEDIAGRHGHSFWMLRSAIEVNVQQRRRVASKVVHALGGALVGKRVAVFGLAFKPGTDDIRQAPALDIIEYLKGRGASVRVTDPMALPGAGGTLEPEEMVTDPYECAAGADAVLVVTEWPEFRTLDWARIATVVRGRVVVDGRNCLDPVRLTDLGFDYVGVGRRSYAGAHP